MKLLKSWHVGLIALLFGAAFLPAQILIPMQSQGTFAVNDVQNLRVLKQSADGSEVTLTLDYSYDGASGSAARLLPIIAGKNQHKVSSWFGADLVTIPAGHGTISIKVKFFNDEPGAPKELTTDRIRIMMLTDSGSSVIAQSIFSRTINWGSPTGGPVENAGEASAKEAADARRILEEKAKVDAEAKALEQARVMAEQERLAAEAKAKADAEAKALEEARVKAEQDRLAAEAKAKADAEAKAAAAALEAARLKAEQNRLVVESAARVSQLAPGASPPAFVLASNFRTKVSNVDIVGRSLDRTEMTIGVDYDFSKEDGKPKMGVDFVSTDDPSVSGYFSSPIMDVGRARHNSLLFPVKLSAAAADVFSRATLPTDKIWVYLVDASGAKSYIYQETMILLWHVPWSGKAAADAVVATQNSAQIETFKQNSLFGGYVIVKYNLLANGGSLHLRVFDSANPVSADWFVNSDVPLKSGPGMQLVKIAVPPDAKSPDVFKADTLEIQMLDEKGNTLATGRKEISMTWARPK